MYDKSDILSLLTSPNFNILASLNKVHGVSTISKYGENSDIDTAAPEDIWSFGGLYTFSTSAIIDTISSSNIGDSQSITILGQDINNEEIEQVAALNGQNKVVLSTPLYRVYRAFNSDGTTLLGDVYIYEDDTISSGVPTTASKVRAMIKIGSNQTEMMIYTVPSGKTLVYTEGFIALTRVRAGAADFTLRTISPGGASRVKRRIALNSQGTGTWNALYSVARVIQEKTDILFRCEEVSANGMGVSGGFEGYLFDNDYYKL